MIEDLMYKNEQDILQELEAEAVNDLLKQGYTFDKAIDVVQGWEYHNILECMAKQEFLFLKPLKHVVSKN